MACLALGCTSRSDTGQRPPKRRVVVLGFDGLDPDLLGRWIADLPHVNKLMTDGSFFRLATTTPPDSCTAWTSFATGLGPGRHGVFGAVERVPDGYGGRPSGPRENAAGYLWGWLRLGPPTLTRESAGERFWHRADRAGLRSVVLHVPCAFPFAAAEHGHWLGGQGVPDLRGDDGYQVFSTRALESGETNRLGHGRGTTLVAAGPNGELSGSVEGPVDPTGDGVHRLSVPLRVVRRGLDDIDLEIQGHRATVELGRWSGWMRMSFEVSPLSHLSGMARFRLVSLQPDLTLFMSPLSADPADAPFALSEPFGYAGRLHDAIGDFETAGWNHRTSGLDDELLDEAAFLENVFDHLRTSEDMTFRELDTRPAELFVSVFVDADETSHLMYRLLDEASPRYDAALAAAHGDAIRQTYRRMDEIVGKVMTRMRADDVLLVVSAYGFSPWNRVVDLNAWLSEHGYLTIAARSGAAAGAPEIDWAHTRAYALGRGAIRLNLAGREPNGVVEPGAEALALERGIAAQLEKLVDPSSHARAVADVRIASETWSGPRLGEAPDLQVGFRPGWAAREADPDVGVAEHVFSDNDRKWSGDHATGDAATIEGVLLVNRRLAAEHASIEDVAPTVLSLLGIEVGDGYDGRALKLEARTDQVGGS